MPTYEYKCSKNDHFFDLIQSFSDEPGAICPECGSESERQFSTPSIIYKGSGFYTTDYVRNGSSSNGKSAGSGNSGNSDSKTESSSSSDTKSESKATSDSSGSSGSKSGSDSRGSKTSS